MSFQPIEHEMPAILLTYVGSGFPQLRTLVDPVPEIEWLPGASLVQLCERLAVEWRIIDETPDGISALARKSIKAVVQTMVTSRLLRGGRRRWFGTAIGAIPTPECTFTALYPGARFVILHRQCVDVIFSGIASCPWGLSNSGYGYDGFAAVHAGNSVSALADYWATNTALMLNFENALPDRCLRIRYEDLADDPQKTLQGKHSAQCRCVMSYRAA
jgi:hypothetical protein